jgi:hypothetical protein
LARINLPLAPFVQGYAMTMAKPFSAQRIDVLLVGLSAASGCAALLRMH